MAELAVLDLAPVSEGKTPADAFKNARDLAQHVERWGYNRYWVAEHHNMVGIASAATSVVIGYIAGSTDQDQGGGRRHHAAQPFTDDHCRAIRNAGIALSRPD